MASLRKNSKIVPCALVMALLNNDNITVSEVSELLNKEPIVRNLIEKLKEKK